MSEITETIEKPKKISTRRIKAQRLVHATLKAQSEGRTLADVGREFYPTAAHPSQTVTNCLKQPSAQEELARIGEKYFDESELRERLTDVIRRPKVDSYLMKGLELGMKSKGMLIDKQEQTQTVLAKRDDLSSIDTGSLVSELVQRLKMSGQGLRIGQQSSEDGQGKAIDVTTGQSNA